MWQYPTDPGTGGPPGAPPPGPSWQPPFTPPQFAPPPFATAPFTTPPFTTAAPRRPRSRAAVVGIVAACVLALAVLGAAITGAVAAGRAAGHDMAAAAPVPLQTAAPVDPTGLGNDPGLDGYSTRCHDGDMQACDDLYDLSDPMSRYEQYGMTCGGRVKPFDVGYCTDLG